MKLFFQFLIFLLVLFFYLHIYYHLKTSNDLELYTIEEPSKDKLEEVCNLRQPVLFNFDNELLLKECNLTNLVDNYGAFDVKMREPGVIDDNSEMYLPFILNESIQLFQKKDGKYITENNGDFLQETGVVKKFQYNDAFLRPPLVSNCLYDFQSGAINAETPLRYNMNFRNFYYVTSGKITVKLIPPKSHKYLYIQKDYDNFEFRSLINPWNVQSQYKNDFGKVKVLDIEIDKGQMLVIPPYWLYSIKYNKLSSICVFKYRTFMNNVAILPHLCLYLLQNQNIKRNMVSVVKSNNEVEDTKNNVENKNHPGNKITPSSNEIIKGESTVTPSTATFNPPPIPVAANNTQL
jgi:flagellar assembly factor FliW